MLSTSQYENLAPEDQAQVDDRNEGPLDLSKMPLWQQALVGVPWLLLGLILGWGIL